MKASELIEELKSLSIRLGHDPEVLCQSHGCCYHGHYIEVVEQGKDEDEQDKIIIRV